MSTMNKETVEESRSAPLSGLGDELRTLSRGGQSKAREQQMRSHVHYLGFRTTDDGREYTLRVTGETPRQFVMVIGHGHFASGRARFQDGPDLCCAKLTRVLTEEVGEPAPDCTFVLTGEELLQYQTDRAPSERKRRPRIAPEAGS